MPQNSPLRIGYDEPEPCSRMTERTNPERSRKKNQKMNSVSAASAFRSLSLAQPSLRSSHHLLAHLLLKAFLLYRGIHERAEILKQGLCSLLCFELQGGHPASPDGT